MTFTALGCSALVDPYQANPRCERDAGGPEVCPEGLECRDGRCQPLCPAEVCGDEIDNDCDGQVDEAQVDALEICGDGIDNDCDGQKDEPEPRLTDLCGDGINNDCDAQTDEGSDHDGDQFTGCPNLVNPAAGDDCDDYNPMVNPRAPEVCDGMDNDCDRDIDEPNDALCAQGQACIGQRCVVPSCAVEGTSETCGSGERCDLLLQRCVILETCSASSCPPDQYCDPDTDTCRRVTPSPNGALCFADEDCLSRSCIDAAALRLASGTRVCGKACCDDSQCQPDERCFASGTGARSCLPRTMVPSTVLTQCTTDLACDDEVCALNKSQVLPGEPFVARSELISGTCRDDADGRGLGDSCASYDRCESKVCVPGANLGLICSTVCGSTKDCEEFGREAGGLLGGPEYAYCRYMPVSLDSTLPSSDYAAVCVIDRGGETGPGAYGAACASGADCLDRGCVGATSTTKGRCTPTCCADQDCGFTQKGDPISCRPFAFGLTYEMRCEL